MSAPSRTTVAVSNAVSTRWAATNAPVTQAMSWLLTSAAVRVSIGREVSRLARCVIKTLGRLTCKLHRLIPALIRTLIYKHASVLLTFPGIIVYVK